MSFLLFYFCQLKNIRKKKKTKISGSNSSVYFEWKKEGLFIITMQMHWGLGISNLEG